MARLAWLQPPQESEHVRVDTGDANSELSVRVNRERAAAYGFSAQQVAQFIGMGLLTLLMWEQSPIALPSDVFDNSTGLRTKFYWAQLIMIIFTIPVSFLLNKFWTFRAIRGAKPTVEAA